MPKPYHRNLRQIKKARFDRLNDTLTRLGDLGGIVHNIRTDEIIGGNQRTAVFGQASEAQIVEQYNTPDEQGTVAHGFVVWQGKKYSYRQVDWNEETAAEANIAANIGAGEWSWEILANEWTPTELTEWGFDESLLTNWRLDVASLGNFLESEEVGEGRDSEPQIDRAAELREIWGVELGQLWRLPSRTAGNEHRLICGDCTDAGVVAAVMGGEKADVGHHDPPYGINLLDKPGRLGKSQVYQPIEGDSQPFDPCSVLELAAVTLIWGANHFANKLPPSRFWLVWDKQGGAKDTTFSTCELAWCSDRQPARVLTHVWDGWRRDSEKDEERYHPSQKPVAVIQWALGWVEGETVLDCYCGSGGTIIAAENLSRQCRAIEIAPGYVAVALQRYQDTFGITAELIDTL